MRQPVDLDEEWRRIRSQPYVAEVRQHRSWGPWAWSFELRCGVAYLGEVWGSKRWYAWTRRGVEEKARRVVARIERSERRHFPEWPRRNPMEVRVLG